MIANASGTVVPLQQAKLWLVENTLLARDALHIYVALTLFFGTMLAFRWRASDWRPWLVVLAAALLGEVWDVADSFAYGQIVYWSASWKDIWNTMFWPTVMIMLARKTGLFRSGELHTPLPPGEGGSAGRAEG